ncbi:MAG: class I SAM-dependent methyltransferase [Hyphomicrobiales bacterium]
MSSYNDYGKAAPDYDLTRQAVAYEIWLGALERFAPAKLSDVRLLDAGCGTGNYSAALHPHVGKINGIDYNEGMLAKASGKLADGIASETVKLERGSILALPFEAETFDTVMINQVLHHLGDGKDAAHNGHRAAITEVTRVLKPNGVFLLNACSHKQLTKGFWYNDFIPRAFEDVRARIAPSAMVSQMLLENGFSVVGRHVPVNAVMQGDAYFDMSGIFREDWRAGDSMWSSAKTEELELAMASVEELIATGEADQWLANHDEMRQQIGQMTFWIAQKTQ